MSSPRDNEIVNQNTDEEVAKVTTLLGATNNTGGSATAGTVMAKLNGIFTKATAAATDAAAAKANTAANNTASATGTLSQKLSYIISTLIGATNNTGGSATAGTVMAKLNAIFSKADNTYTQALNGNTKATTIKTNTDTNNTASKTGVLSQKLAYVIGLLENATYGLSALRYNREVCKAGSTVLATIINSEVLLGINATLSKNILINRFDGCINLMICMGGNGTMSITKNDTEVLQNLTLATKEYKNYEFCISVKRGDVLRVTFTDTNGAKTFSCNLLTVCGTVSSTNTNVVAI